MEDISEQLVKASVYRGYRSFYVGLSGIIGLMASYFAPQFVHEVKSLSFVYYWGGVACANLILCGVCLGYQYFFKDTDYNRRKTRQILLQLAHTLGAGLIVCSIAFFVSREMIPILPGLWALIFGLGIFTMRPYLPDITVLAGYFYLAAALVLFLVAGTAPSLLVIGMGIAFGAGQLLSAALLYAGIERASYER
jgi:hypothetical protein